MNQNTKTWLPVAVIAAGLISTAGCKREQPAPPATVEKVKEDPQSYFGRAVTLTGEVDQVYGARAFELESNDLFDEQVLVASRSEMRLGDTPLADDQKVRVTGTVRPMVTVELERELGWDLEPQLEAEYRTRPILIARSVVRVDRPDLAWNETSMAPPGQPSQTAAGQAPPLTDVATIAAAQGRDMADRPVQLEAVPVQETVSDRLFWVGPEDQRVLVVLATEPPTPGTPVEGLVDVNKGQTVSLTGILRMVAIDQTAPPSLKLTQKGEGILRKQTMYVEASRVEVTRKAPSAGRRPPR